VRRRSGLTEASHSSFDLKDTENCLAPWESVGPLGDFSMFLKIGLAPSRDSRGKVKSPVLRDERPEPSRRAGTGPRLWILNFPLRSRVRFEQNSMSIVTHEFKIVRNFQSSAAKPRATIRSFEILPRGPTISGAKVGWCGDEKAVSQEDEMKSG
jgi:hypothetical protein